MTQGPGKYDDIATVAREQAEASAVVLIIFDGIQGHGFSVQCENPDFLRLLPKLLRGVAEDLEKDMEDA